MTEEHAQELEALAEIAQTASDHAEMAANYESSRGFAIIGYLEVIATVATALLRHTYETNDVNLRIGVEEVPGSGQPEAHQLERESGRELPGQVHVGIAEVLGSKAERDGPPPAASGE